MSTAHATGPGLCTSHAVRPGLRPGVSLAQRLIREASVAVLAKDINGKTAMHEVAAPSRRGGATHGYLGSTSQSFIYSGEFTNPTGIAGQRFDLTGNSNVQITGDLEARALVRLGPSGTRQTIYSDWHGATNRWLLEINASGGVGFWTDDGTTDLFTSFPGLYSSHSEGDIIWIQATFDASSGDKEVFTSTDGVTFTQLGATVTTTHNAIRNSTPSPMLGGGPTFDSVSVLRFQIFDGIGGTLAADFDASTAQDGATSVSDGVEGTWTLNLPTGGADSNDPRFMDHSGEDYWWRPAAANNRLYVNDTAALDITGDLDVTFDVAFDDWTAANQMAVAKSNTSTGNFSWQVYINSSTVRLAISADGSSETNRGVGFPRTLDPGERVHWRVRYDASAGEADFFELVDGAWTQVGVTQTGLPTSIFSGSANLEIGSRNNGLAFLAAAGKFYGAEVWDGHLDDGGTKVACFDPADGSGGNWTGAEDGLTWNVGYPDDGEALILVDRPMWYCADDDFIQIPAGDHFATGASDTFSFLGVARWMYQGNDFRLGWTLGDRTDDAVSIDWDANDQPTLRVYENNVLQPTAARATGVVSGQYYAVGGVIGGRGTSGAGEGAYLYTSFDGLETSGVDLTGIGSIHSADTGAFLNTEQGLSNRANQGIHAFLYWKRALTEEELNAVSKYLGAL